MALPYAHRVANGMAGDYGQYLAKTYWPKEWKDDPSKALLWSLCIVNSRATAAYTNPGRVDSQTGVRLVPIADLANHKSYSGGFTELTGQQQQQQKQQQQKQHEYDDIGAFTVRSVWKCGTSREIVLGNEITVNYNLPEFSKVDWFLSLGFIPPELLSTSSTKPHTTTTTNEL